MNQPYLKEKAFLKLLLPYLVGTLLGIAFPFKAVLLPLGATLGLLSVLLWVVHRHDKILPVSKALQWAAILYAWVAFVGVLNTHWANPTTTASHYSHSAHKPGVILLYLDDVPQAKTSTYQVTAQVKGRLQGDSLLPLSGKVMLLLPLDSTAATLAYGDELAINSKLMPTAPPQNPYEFDYSVYLANKHIYHQLSPKADRWYATGRNHGHWLFAWVYQVRDQALAVLQAHLPQPEHFGVASAMLLGYRGALDAETRQQYTITGSMHVLAVSGMHVGLLYFLLGWVLLPLKRFRQPWLRFGILLLVVWLYALLTGLSASVLRASLMFSLFALGETLKRRPDSVNILAASALLLLLWEPRQLLDVGFQLSYLAVLGIVYFYKPLHNLWPIKNKYARFFWEGTCISIAAQLATLPLVLLYFHQMPVYALLANVGMLVLAPAVMFIGIGLLVLFWLPGLDWLLGHILQGTLWLMDALLGWIAALPNAAIKAIYPTLLDVLLLFGVLASLIAATKTRWVKPIMIAACFLTVLLGTSNYRMYEQKQQQQLVVYQYPQYTAMAALNGHAANLWIDSLALADTVKMERSIYPYIHANGIGLPETKLLEKPKTNDYGMLGQKRFALLRKYTRKNLPKEKLKVDFLVLSGNPSISMLQLKKVYDAHYVIIDGSNNIKATERWMRECKVLGLNCHNTRHGAFIASW